MKPDPEPAELVDQALAIVDPVPEPELTIKVRGFDFDAKGSLYGFLDMSDAQFRLQDAFENNDQREVIKSMRQLIDGLRPFLMVEPDEDLDTELRQLSVNQLFALANAVKTHNPVPNENASPSKNGHKATARRRRG